MNTTNTFSNTTTQTISRSKFNLGRLLFAISLAVAVFFISYNTDVTNVYEPIISSIIYFVAVARIMKKKINKYDFIAFLIFVSLGTIYGTVFSSSLAGGLSFGIGFVGGSCALFWLIVGNFVADCIQTYKEDLDLDSVE
jgi:uncharacterized membrane protein